MKVTCPSCQKTVNVPDEKIPEGKPVKFKCPGCGQPVTVSREEGPPGGLPKFEGVPETTPTSQILDETQNVPVPPPSPEGTKASLEAMAEALEDEMEMLAEGARRALVADTENLERISPVLRKLEYLITAVKTGEEAVRKLEHNFYDLVIINERFAGADPKNNPPHKFIEPMDMETRRKMFVAMVGKNFKTLDNMAAFVRSVNIVINEADFPNLELILRKSMNESETFFRVYRDTLIETGKEV